jgi:hypothetical protein
MFLTCGTLDASILKMPKHKLKKAGRSNAGTKGSEVKDQSGNLLTYEIRALGYCVEVTAHRLRRREVEKVVGWCEREGCEVSDISGNLEEALEGYNCYSTNLWQSGIVPLVGGVRFVLIGPEGNEVFSARELSAIKGGVKSDPPFETVKGGGNVLVYFEEYKGLAATWVLPSSTPPDPRDLSVLTNAIVVGGEATEFVAGLYYQNVEMERDYENENFRGKAAYSRLI